MEGAKAKVAYKVVVTQTHSESNVLEIVPDNKDNNLSQNKVENKKNNESNLKKLKLANAMEIVAFRKVTKDGDKASKMGETKLPEKNLPVNADDNPTLKIEDVSIKTSSESYERIKVKLTLSSYLIKIWKLLLCQPKLILPF